MKISVRARLPKPLCAPWRSVVLRAEFPESGTPRFGAIGQSVLDWTEIGRPLGEATAKMRALVRELAERHKLPKKQAVVITRTGVNSGIYGYVRVFRGSGTRAERALFRKIYNSATKINVDAVRVHPHLDLSEDLNP